ncbi:hypothetical protein [Bacillus toyonensis]|nr:hypothetical protein [Bacillus toyonensis]
MRRGISIFLLVVGVIGSSGAIIHAEKMEQHPKLKQEFGMYKQDPGGS